MSDEGWYGRRVAEHSGIRSQAPVHLLGNERTGTAATKLELVAANPLRTDPTPTTEAFVLTLPFAGVYQREVWLDGSGRSCAQTVLPGDFSFMDLRRNAQFLFTSPFSLVQFYVPRRALDDVTDELASTRIDEFSIQALSCHTDPVMSGLADSIRPTFSRPNEASMLYIDSVIRATSVHLAVRYGELRAIKMTRGALALWQERRALEFIDANLDGEILLEDVAKACGLSTSYFTRAFRHSFGQAPHQWLLARRLERAKALMVSTNDDLTVIALACGFADQSHFTRVFSTRVGSSPGAWRKASRGASAMEGIATKETD